MILVSLGTLVRPAASRQKKRQKYDHFHYDSRNEYFCFLPSVSVFEEISSTWLVSSAFSMILLLRKAAACFHPAALDEHELIAAGLQWITLSLPNPLDVVRLAARFPPFHRSAPTPFASQECFSLVCRTWGLQALRISLEEERRNQQQREGGANGPTQAPPSQHSGTVPRKSAMLPFFFAGLKLLDVDSSRKRYSQQALMASNLEHQSLCRIEVLGSFGKRAYGKVVSALTLTYFPASAS